MSAIQWRRGAVVCAVSALVFSSCGGDTPTRPTPPTPPVEPTPPPPALTVTCPAPPSGISHNNQPVTLTWTDPTAAGGTAPYAVACTPASGSQFAPGSTPVTCRATDAGTQTASCAFAVSVAWVPQLAATRYLAFGDSMTAGVVSPAPFVLIESPESYPFKLGQLLAARYLDQSTLVDNDGKPGELAQPGAERLRSSILRNRPEVVLLWEGANDLLACSGVSGFDACIQYRAIPDIIRGLSDQIRTGKDSEVRVMLATHPPQRVGGTPARGDAAAWVPELNRQIAALAASRDVPLVDLYAAFPTNIGALVGVDGLHLTETGYALVAQTFLDAIKKAYDVPYPSSVR